ncbi:unnamed protein product [Dicrocoelium dendriticum]|nr:unnamed protein product [Dicrocoelium dendriticum]
MAGNLQAETEFLTGVVEGFYGRPWTYPQRKELFRRMNHMGMNAYLYAPKDDVKHRQSWRDLYTPAEEEQLQSLINESTEAGVLFIFSLSPGLDVTFSSAKEVEILKKKVDQVSKLGCRAFALLFDDIEPRLCPADREVFSSSARAQVVFANDLYNYLGCPSVFLFCPTEYCASLALPSITKSEYLSTVSSCLAPGIAVIWTGPLVVSKNIRTSDVEHLSQSIKHPIVLWDNLHANDYDQRRVFIGPYSGRPLDLRRKGLLRGVLTNPNCEFEANYVALHTLAQWSRYGELRPPAHPPHKEMLERLEDTGSPTASTDSAPPATIDNCLERNNADTRTEETDSSYKPREALLVALRDWLALMLQDQQMAHASSKSVTAGGTPTPMDTDIPDVTTTEAMVVEPSPGATIPDVPVSDLSSSNACSFVDVTLEDLELFADLFYLPFAHGPSAVRLLELGHWLRDQSHACGPNPSDPEKKIEWVQKLSEFAEMVSLVARLRDRIQRLPSRGIAYELAPYVTEVHTVLGMVLDYFHWLETGVMSCRSMCHLRRLLTWFSPGYRDMVTSGDQEPWTFRGGLITELQRILPLESAQDLFPAPSRAVPETITIPTLAWPDVPAVGIPPGAVPFIPIQPPVPLPRSTRSCACVVRPYRPEDTTDVYNLFRRLLLARVGLHEGALPPELSDLPGDRYLLHFLEHSPENCLVVEGPPFISCSSTGVGVTTCAEIKCVGFDFAAPDAVAWARDRTARYRNSLRLKYPRPSTESPPTDAGPDGSKATHQSTNETTPSTFTTKSPMTPDEFIRFLLHPFHAELIEVSDIADAAAVLPPPEPLGGTLPVEPALSGCLEGGEVEPSRRDSAFSPLNIPLNVPPPPFPIGCPPFPPVIPPPLLPDIAPPSPPSVAERTPTVNLRDSCPSNSIGPVSGFARPVIMAGGPEALHTALAAHPAILWAELDDIGVVNFTGGPTPSMLMNHNLGLGVDPPELILDSVARRLFICLLAGLKTIGAHGSHVHLDAINEHRAELYRRFGFYPVAAASTDQTTILARLI